MPKKIQFDFDEFTHTYKINNRKIPSVTQAIEGVFGTKPYYKEWHAQRGRAVHKAIQILSNGNLDWDSVHPLISSRVKAYLKFQKDFNLVPYYSETMLFSKRYRFAGTLDLVMLNLSNQKILIDIKSTIEPIVDLQIGGYCLLWEENYKNKPNDFCAVELKDNSNYNIRWIKNINHAKRRFLSVLDIYNFKQENNI